MEYLDLSDEANQPITTCRESSNCFYVKKQGLDISSSPKGAQALHQNETFEQEPSEQQTILLMQSARNFEHANIRETENEHLL